MKTSKHLISIIVTYLTLGFFVTLSADISPTDKRINELIEKYTPVYDASSLLATQIYEESTVYDPASYDSQTAVASVVVRLEGSDSVPKSPKPVHTLMKSFIGYSDKNSYLQLYIKPMSIFGNSEGRPFGEKIPLTPGSPVIEAKDEKFGKLRVSLKVSSAKLDIKVAESGNFFNTWEDAPIYEVEIKRVERL